MERCVAPAGGHRPGDERAPGLAIEAHAAVEAIAEPLRIGQGERHQGGGHVAVHPLEDDADLLGLVGLLVGRREGEDRLVGKLVRGHRR